MPLWASSRRPGEVEKRHGHAVRHDIGADILEDPAVRAFRAGGRAPGRGHAADRRHLDASATSGGPLHQSHQPGAGRVLRHPDRPSLRAAGPHGGLDLHQVPHLCQDSDGRLPPLVDGRVVRVQGARRDHGVGAAAGLLVFLAAAPVRRTCHRAQVGDHLSRLHGLVFVRGRPRRQRFPRSRIMTQALDMNERVVPFGRAHAVEAPAARSAASSSKFGTFAVAFGIALAILYTLCERQNWPLFTYHPAVDHWDIWREPGRPEDGPPMFWYGWVVLSSAGAAVVGLIATMVSVQRLYRAAIFFCVLAALWPAFFALADVIDERASFNAEFLR